MRKLKKKIQHIKTVLLVVLFFAGKLATKNKPDFVQLNLGYRITPKNIVALEFITWKYAWSLGTPYGDSFEAPGEKFPGYVLSYGVGLVYQRFLWKGAYAAVEALNNKQRHFDKNNKKIANGYQLFMTYRIGYQVKLFNNRFFIEPSVAVTHRPIDTNIPNAFAVLDKKWSKFFFPEPGLHLDLIFRSC